jgi:hypothetical protein
MLKTMRTISIAAALFFTQAICSAKDPAYQALRTAAGGNQALFNRVVEVQGAKGDPQPTVWRIVLDDPQARGGVRELEVSNGRVISEHTPIRAYAGAGASAVMDFKKLNLDSTGAFTIANQEAAKRHAGFDLVDYSLRSDAQTSAPVWVLKLLDSDGRGVGTLFIAATDGAILRTEGFGASNPDSAFVSPTPRVQPARGSDDDESDLPPKEERIGYKIKKGFLNAGGVLQGFFSGRRPPPPERDYPDAPR